MKMKTLPPATMIMTFHREEHYAHKSLLGMERVRQYSNSFGHELHLICVLDNSNESTTQIIKDYIHHYGLPTDQIIETKFASPAAARNTGMDYVKTEYVGVLDGDDFVSANWVQAALSKQINNINTPMVCAPEYIISFGNIVEHMKVLYSKHIPMTNMMEHNFWSAATFSATHIYREVPYNERVNTASRFAYEDYDFNLRCIAKGILIEPVKDSYLFYRRRTGSTLSQHVALRSFTPPSDFLNQFIL